jgi:hypothetical protein
MNVNENYIWVKRHISRLGKRRHVAGGELVG